MVIPKAQKDQNLQDHNQESNQQREVLKIRGVRGARTMNILLLLIVKMNGSRNGRTRVKIEMGSRKRGSILIVTGIPIKETEIQAILKIKEPNMINKRRHKRKNNGRKKTRLMMRINRRNNQR